MTTTLGAARDAGRLAANAGHPRKPPHVAGSLAAKAWVAAYDIARNGVPAPSAYALGGHFGGGSPHRELMRYGSRVGSLNVGRGLEARIVDLLNKYGDG